MMSISSLVLNSIETPDDFFTRSLLETVANQRNQLVIQSRDILFPIHLDEDAGFPVMIQKRPGGLIIDLQALANDVLRVIAAPCQTASALVAVTGLAGRARHQIKN